MKTLALCILTACVCTLAAMTAGCGRIQNILTPVSDSEQVNDIDRTAPIITIVNPDTTPAHTKQVSASFTDAHEKAGWYWWYILTDSATCDEVIIADNTAWTAYVEGMDIHLDQESYNSLYICFRAEDEAGNTTYAVSTQIGGIDRTSPVVRGVVFNSNNKKNTAYAVVGDILTVVFVVSETLAQTPIVQIAGNIATVNVSGNIYTATYQVTNTTTEGVVTYDIGVMDLAGNIAYYNAEKTAVTVLN